MMSKRIFCVSELICYLINNPDIKLKSNVIDILNCSLKNGIIIELRNQYYDKIFEDDRQKLIVLCLYDANYPEVFWTINDLLIFLTNIFWNYGDLSLVCRNKNGDINYFTDESNFLH